MAQKKAKPASSTRRSEEDKKAQGSSDALTGALYHNRRMYDHTKARDQKEFAALAAKEGALAPPEMKDPAERKAAHKEALQRMADQGVLKGYGTKAPAKSKRSEEDESHPVTLTEQQALDQKAEEDEDDE